MARYKLKLKQLDFVSLVDEPAQPNAKCLLIKRAGNVDEISATARLVKTSDELGLAFFWAFTTTEATGADHFDLHGDQVLSDNDMIKAAAEFMEKGGAVDEMHDSEKTGRVVFAMPMTPEIAAAYGVTTKTSGLMVALRPSTDAMAKLKDGTYSAVSIAGLGERIELHKSAPTKVLKSSLYTDEVDGHQHEICVYEDGSFYVRYATSAGADREHSHGIVFENGALTILADSGHTHELAEGQPGLIMVPADAIVIVQNRNSSTTNRLVTGATAQTLASKSTRNTGMSHGGVTREETMSTTPDLAKQLADITKQLEHANKLATLTDAQRAYFKSKTGADAETFLAKSHDEREAVLAKAFADDPIEVEFNGQAYRKSAGPAVLELAKAAKAQAETLAQQTTAIEKADIRKAALDTLGGMPGDDETHDFIIASLRKGGDPVKAQKALETLKGMKATSTIGKGAPGAGGQGDPTAVTKQSAFAALEKGLEGFAKANNITANVWSDGLAKFKATAEGKALSDAYDATLR